MASQPSPRNRNVRLSGAAGVVALLSLVLAACGGASAAPSATSASPVATSAPVAGPTTWAAWIDHQGFGGQLGPNEVRRMARSIADHGGAEDVFNLDEDLALVTGIIAWLDAHPATPCWTDYRAQLRAHLVSVRDGWTRARPAVEGGQLVPADVVTDVVAAANAANDLPVPEDCP